MIALVHGKIIEKEARGVIIDVGGVGYRVAIPENELSEMSNGDVVTVHTYLVVKEDALDLYGSKNTQVLAWFELLLSVKGIGPKSALSILSLVTPKDLSSAIAHESSDVLTALGVGPKPADRIVLELKTKARALIQGVDIGESGAVAIDAEAMQALESLGYTRDQARRGLKDAEGEDVSAKVKSALKVLGK